MKTKTIFSTSIERIHFKYQFEVSTEKSEGKPSKCTMGFTFFFNFKLTVKVHLL